MTFVIILNIFKIFVMNTNLKRVENFKYEMSNIILGLYIEK